MYMYIENNIAVLLQEPGERYGEPGELKDPVRGPEPTGAYAMRLLGIF